MLHSTIFRYIIILLSGASLTLAFAPFNIWPLAIICPALLLFFWENTPPKQACLTGIFFGLGFFSTGVSWVYISLHDYGQANALLAGILTFLMILVLLSYTAIAGYVLNRFFSQPKFSRYVLAFPSLWVLAEWCRGWVFTGFPWLFLGYSQLNTPLAGWAPIVSVFGVSWMVALTAGVLTWVAVGIRFTTETQRHRENKKSFNFFITLKSFIFYLFSVSLCLCGKPSQKQRNQQYIFVAIILITLFWTGGFFLKKIHWTHPDGKPISVSLVQGNIAQTLKWTPDQIKKTLSIYEKLTQPYWHNQLIIWPEAAITEFQTQAQDYLHHLDQIAKKHHSTLITGIPILENNQAYNGMLALGAGTGSYKKRHLVPFGEFIPFRFLLAWLNNYVQIPMSDFSRGDRYQPLIQANHIPIAAFICYEIAYPAEVLDGLPEGKLLLVISDDSWFGKSIAPAQHLQIAQMRALETGRYVLASTNDGVTAIINSQGKITHLAPTFTTTVLNGTVQPMVGSTPWMRIGIYLILITVLLLLLIVGWASGPTNPNRSRL